MQHGGTHIPFRPVLIVNDIASDAMTIDLLCRSLGVETICTASAAEAAAALIRTRPAAIITDLHMLGTERLDCLFMVAKHAPAAAVMVIADATELLPETARALGENYGLGNLVSTSKSVNINTLRTFLISSGIMSMPSCWDLH
jgi:CheY-like chemotaxis protein